MPVITISSDSPELEAGIAREVAQRLGYRLVSRELLDKVAGEQGVAREELVRALEEPPRFLGLRPRRRRELLTHIQCACLEELQSDDVVCHGLAAHLYVTGVSHAMRVRLLADPGAQDAGPAAQERRRWSQEAFGSDETDPGQYDMVLSLATLEPGQVVEMICEAAGYPKFQAMTYSRKSLADSGLACRVRQELLQRFPEAKVTSSDGTVVVQVQSLKRDRRKKQEAVRQLASQVDGVRYVEVHVINDIFGQAAQS